MGNSKFALQIELAVTRVLQSPGEWVQVPDERIRKETVGKLRKKFARSKSTKIETIDDKIRIK